MRLALLIAVGSLLAARPALAEEGEWRAGGQVGYATSTLGPRSGGGPAAFATGSYGMTEALTLKLRGGYSRHGLDADMKRKLTEGTSQVWLSSLGVEYTLDVLVVVPTFELGVGYTHISEDGRPSASELLLLVGIGLDYLWSRKWTLGIGAQYHVLLTDPQRTPVYVAFGPRVAYLF